ncbi:MAG: zinc ribbon domain-containing protein [Elusimicrobiota bacterium]|nr:zinc ribbon domain-containing protein [Elusimicrobiota bacterium]
MPIHSFVCKKCGASFELLVNVTTESFGENHRCEKCGGTDITRTFSNFAVSSSSGSCGGTPGDSCDMANNSPGCCPGCKIK